MIRCWPAGFAVLVLAFAFLQAPFAHFHPGDPEHHHATGIAHAHLNFLAHDEDAHGPEWEDHDDDEAAVYLDWAPAPSPKIAVVYAEVQLPFERQPLFLSPGAVVEFAPQSHDPPILRSLSPRAPPV